MLFDKCKNKDNYHIYQLEVLIFRENPVFSSSQPFKQPIRFLKISLTADFVQDELDPRRFFNDGKRNSGLMYLSRNFFLIILFFSWLIRLKQDTGLCDLLYFTFKMSTKKIDV